ncbi:MAG: hypothetical protein WBJ33_09740, partial [Candidatus Nanopelagicales bacterium]
MTKIILDRTVFANAENLAEMIRRRGIEVLLVDGWPTDTAEKSPILVMSGAAEAAMGGTQKLLERARALRPMRVAVIDEAAEAFSIREELEGKLQRLSLRAEEARTPYGQAIAVDTLC